MAETIVNKNQFTAVHRVCLYRDEDYPYEELLRLQGNVKTPWMDGNIPWLFDVCFRLPPSQFFQYNTAYAGIVGSASNGGEQAGIEVLVNNEDVSTHPDRCRLGIGLSTTGSGWDLAWFWGEYTLKPMTFYTVRLSYDLSKYTISYKEGIKGEFVTLQQYTSSTKLCGDALPKFGSKGESSIYNKVWPFTELDVNNTLMKSGSTVYFGGVDMLQNSTDFTFDETAVKVNEYNEIA